METPEHHQYKETSVSVVVQGGNVLFRALDIGKLLGASNIHRSAINLPDKNKCNITTTTPGGPQKQLYFTFYGALTLLIKSEKPDISDVQVWLEHLCDEIKERENNRLLTEAITQERQRIQDEVKDYGLYAFKLDITKPANKSWKIGKGITVANRENAHRTTCPNGKMVRIVKCGSSTIMDLMERNLLELMKGTGCHIHSECFHIEDPKLVDVAMDFVSYLIQLYNPSRLTTVVELQYITQHFSSMFDLANGVPLLDRQVTFPPNKRVPVVRLDPLTNEVLEVYISVKSATKSPNSKDAEDLRQAVLQSTPYKKFKWRIWDESIDPPLPSIKRVIRTVEKRHPETRELIETFPTATAAGTSVRRSAGAVGNALNFEGGGKVECGGFVWTFAQEKNDDDDDDDDGDNRRNEPSPKRPRNGPPSKQVRCTNSDGTTTIYASAKEAAKAHNVSGVAISSAIARKGTCVGKTWHKLT